MQGLRIASQTFRIKVCNADELHLPEVSQSQRNEGSEIQLSTSCGASDQAMRETVALSLCELWRFVSDSPGRRVNHRILLGGLLRERIGFCCSQGGEDVPAGVLPQSEKMNQTLKTTMFPKGCEGVQILVSDSFWKHPVDGVFELAKQVKQTNLASVTETCSSALSLAALAFLGYLAEGALHNVTADSPLLIPGGSTSNFNLKPCTSSAVPLPAVPSWPAKQQKLCSFVSPPKGQFVRHRRFSQYRYGTSSLLRLDTMQNLKRAKQKWAGPFLTHEQ